MLGEMVKCAAVSSHLYIQSRIQVHVTHHSKQLHSDLRDVNGEVSVLDSHSNLIPIKN